jgi:DNA-binding GntR family transcriptional regulator
MPPPLLALIPLENWLARVDQEQREHRAIVRALEKRDPEAVVRAISNHLKRAKESLVADDQSSQKE